jgi:sugar phosphate permease
MRLRSPGTPGLSGERNRPETLRAMLRIYGMPAALLASFGAKGSLDLVTAYLPLLGNEIGLRASAVGLLLSLSSASALAARASMPWLVRHTRTVRLMAITTLVSGICVALLPLGKEVVVLATLMVVLGYVLALSQTVTMVWVVGLVPTGSRGSALGMRLASNRVGQVAVPGLAGLLSGSAGVTAVFYILAGVLGVISGVVVRTAHEPD